MLSSEGAGVLSTTLQSILYGISLPLFMLGGWTLLRGRSRRQVNWWILSAGVGLLVISTTDVAINVFRLYQGFLTSGPRMPGGPEEYFADVTLSTYVIKSVLYDLQTLTFDAVMIYRTSVVWESLRIAIVPILAWFSLIATSIGLTNALLTATANQYDLFAVTTGGWITALHCIVLFTNLSSTLLLVYKIWQASRKSPDSHLQDILPVVARVIVESGAIYSVTIFAALMTFLARSPVADVILDTVPPIISIVFNTVIIRIGLSSGRLQLFPPLLRSTTKPYSAPNFGAKILQTFRDKPLPILPTNVHNPTLSSATKDTELRIKPPSNGR